MDQFFTLAVCLADYSDFTVKFRPDNRGFICISEVLMKLIILGYNVFVFAQQQLLSESSGTAMVPLAGAINFLSALRGDVSIHGMWSRKSGCFSDAFLLEVNKELLAKIQPLFASSPWPCLYWQLCAGKTPALTAIFIKPNENLNRIWHIIKYYVSILWTLCTLRKWVNKKEAWNAESAHSRWRRKR